MKNHHLSYTHLDGFVLSYVTEGEGRYLLKKKLYAIKKGDLFLNLPAVIYSQYSLPENPYTYYYVAFQGSACSQLLQQAGLSEFSPVLHLNEPYIEKQMKKIYTELSEKYLFFSYQSQRCSFQYFLVPHRQKSSKSFKVKQITDGNLCPNGTKIHRRKLCFRYYRSRYRQFDPYKPLLFVHNF